MITRASTLLLVVLSLVTGMGAPISTPAAQIQAGEFAVEFFPIAPYHIGDILSARVTYTGEVPADNWEITAALADEPDEVLQSTTFSRHNRQAIFYWIVDTADMAPGFLSFQFTLPEASQIGRASCRERV